MTGRQPLQSTNNLPSKPSTVSQNLHKKPDTIQLPVRVPGFNKPTAVKPMVAAKPMMAQKPESGSKQMFKSDSASKPVPVSSQPIKPGSGSKPLPTSQSSSGSKPSSTQATSSSAAKTDSKEAVSTGIGGLGGKAGDKQHRWKLEDFDIGRPLGKVCIYLNLKFPYEVTVL